MSTLADEHCQPLAPGTAPLGRAQIDALLPEVPGWSYDGRVVAKTYSFEDFHRTMAFVNALAWIAHREDHHPDLAVGYNRCRVELSTHSIGGISRNDFVCAARIERLLRG
jgi:4a-hydroxytetrahydrobiopterin dehydratase